jgi:hypothetical protein
MAVTVLGRPKDFIDVGLLRHEEQVPENSTDNVLLLRNPVSLIYCASYK